MGIHQELTDRTRAVMPDWLALYYDEPIAIDRGEGRTVWDLEGNEYLDFFGGILTTMTAYSLPEVTAAINEQAAKVLHTSTLYLNEPMVELAARPFGSRIGLTWSGSCADGSSRSGRPGISWWSSTCTISTWSIG